MKKLQDQVTEFHRVMGQPVATVPTMLDTERKRLRMSLILEEVQELAEALGASERLRAAFESVRVEARWDAFDRREDLVAAADALGDTDYVVTGTAVEMGIDLGACTDEIHVSNLSKVGGGMNGAGKVQKGPNYRPPNIAAVLERCSGPDCRDVNGGS